MGWWMVKFGEKLTEIYDLYDGFLKSSHFSFKDVYA
jgi:hypothetical protein